MTNLQFFHLVKKKRNVGLFMGHAMRMLTDKNLQKKSYNVFITTWTGLKKNLVKSTFVQDS